MEDIISRERSDALAKIESLQNKEKRLVIFSDYGLDDACATAYLLNNRTDYENIDIMPIAGNVHAVTATNNAKKLLAAAKDDGLNLSGVRLIDSVSYYQDCFTLPAIHGNDGMGDIFDDVATFPVPKLEYAEWTASIAEGYRILSLGPCTMVKRALADAVNLPSGKIVLMGGCNRVPPNFGKYEFNDGIDHNAFVWTLRRPHVAATLDTCHVPAFNTLGARRGGSRLLDVLMNRCTELAELRGEKANYIYDQIAALALMHPEFFDVEEVFAPDLLRFMNELRLKDEYAEKGYNLD